MKRLIRSDILFLSMIFTLPFTGFPVFEIGFTVQISYIFALLTLFSLIVEEIHKHSLKIIYAPLMFPAFLFLFIIFLSIFQSHFIPIGTKYMIHANTELFIHRPWIRSFVQFFALLFMIIPFFLTVYFSKTKEMLYRIIYIWLIANLIASLYGLYGFVGHYLHFPFTKFATFEGYDLFMIRRIKSVGLEPLLFGISITAILPLGICLGFIKKKKWLFFLIIPQLLALVLTFSRGTWLALIISLIIISFSLKDFLLKNIIKVFFSILFLFIILELLFHFLFHFSAVIYIRDRFLYIFSGKADYSNLTRFDTWITAWRMFKAHPILGVGIGNFWFHYYKYSPLLLGDWWIGKGAIPPTVNNLFLSFLAETGILGVSALIVFWFALFKMVIKSIFKTKDSEWQTILIGNLACLLCLLIGYQFISTFYFTYVWVLFGVSVAINNILVRESTA